MKRKGVTLIETIISLMILTVIITLFVTQVKDYSINLYTRITKEKLSRVSYCIMNELKYNYTKENILEQSNSNKIELKNYDDILEDLKYKDLLELDRGDGIIISFNDGDNESLNIKISIYEEGFIEEREFIKWR